MKVSKVIDFLLCTIALALGVTVVVLTVLNRTDPRVDILLLGGAICCIGLALLDVETPVKTIKQHYTRQH